MIVRKAYEVVAELIKNDIESGKRPPGSRLESVEQLAEKYQVGRSTIREALMALKAQGLVDIRQGGGTFVLEKQEKPHWHVPQVSNAGELKDWLEVRFMLETEGASLAAERRDDDHLKELEAALASMVHAHDEDEAEQADTRFHLAVAAASGNKLLYGALQTLLLSMGSAMKESRGLWLFAEHAPAERLAGEHRRILEAIRAQQPAAAKRRMGAHLRKVELLLRNIRL